jgi:hypothetical protein
MTGSTLFPLAFPALLALAACQSADTEGSVVAAARPDMAEWRLASGKVPTKAEFAALSATCEAKGGAVDPCFADLGLKRAP